METSWCVTKTADRWSLCDNLNIRCFAVNYIVSVMVIDDKIGTGKCMPVAGDVCVFFMGA
ncbi:hypothetical protein DN068_15740 [Taibaiella soli]|uniref:Uncharacterized protein n=1 Tax=Taibaiella soli TaxID=1649169 RepID=A0A2W2AIB4_9BACT|nr:hypothetical protein DN068_15740 [Taibaiella soli]